jgi:transposase InsO family protein
MCRVMGVSRSGFYDYLTRVSRELPKREQEDIALLKQITEIFEESSKRYGSPRIHAELHKCHVVCSLKRVKRLMREAGIYALPKRKYRRRKTLETLSAAANLLVPKPNLVKVNQVWYTDITFVKTGEGWLYLAAVMDAYSKRIVGYAMDGNMKTDLVIQALRMAAKQRQVVKGLIHHSDKGSQYTSHAYQRELAAQGMRPSFTGTGACLDNAYIESFFATLKKELVYQSSFATREEARLAVSEFINMYYNSWRLHSSLGYRCPNDFETQGLARLAA